MMKFHKPGRLRMLGGAAAIATLGGLSVSFGSAGAVAHPHPPAPPAPRSAEAPRDGAERREERVMTCAPTATTSIAAMSEGARSERRGSSDGERREERRIHVTPPATATGNEIRTVDVRGHDGHPVHMVVVPRDCEGGGNRSEVNEGTPNNRTRVIVCTRTGAGEGNPAQHAEALQRARSRLAEDNDIPAEQRQRVLAAVDREASRGCATSVSKVPLPTWRGRGGSGRSAVPFRARPFTSFRTDAT